jgi:hypothetical protein
MLLLVVLAGCSVESTKPVSQEPRVVFDGQSYSGWILTGGTRSFMIEAGVLAVGDEPGVLTLSEELEDFELQCEVRSDAGSSAGIAVRAPRDGTTGSAPVIALADQAVGAMGKDAAGSIRGFAPATSAAMDATGTWNKLVIRVQGPNVRVTLNGTRVAEAQVPMPTRGHVAIVGSGEFFWLRDLRIQTL